MGSLGYFHGCREPQPRYLDHGHPASTSEVRTQLIVKDSGSDWTMFFADIPMLHYLGKQVARRILVMYSPCG
jgi:hypothetical protein